MEKHLNLTAWEEANPYENTCDEMRCVWILQRKKGNCPHCEADHVGDATDMIESEWN